MKPLEITKIARNVLREANAVAFGFLATNKYQNCRTVKSYIRAESGGETLVRVMQGLEKAGVQGWYAKRIPSGLPGGCYESLIIRLPL